MDQDESAYEFSNRPRVLMTVGDSGVRISCCMKNEEIVVMCDDDSILRPR